MCRVSRASPLARRPYDLRHAAVSTWLNAGVPATQVAEWAGHSVAVLLQIYAKCLAGQDETARKRIDATLRDPSPTRKHRHTGHKYPQGIGHGRTTPDRRERPLTSSPRSGAAHGCVGWPVPVLWWLLLVVR